MRAQQSFPPELVSAARARRFSEVTLESWACDGVVDTVRLLLSELVVNAVLHAGTRVAVRLSCADGVVHVEVEDESALPIDGPKRVSPDTPNGRGLAIVDALADEWGVESTARGKYVWFDITPDDHPRRRLG